jgi:hypothetical protein
VSEDLHYTFSHTPKWPYIPHPSFIFFIVLQFQANSKMNSATYPTVEEAAAAAALVVAGCDDDMFPPQLLEAVDAVIAESNAAATTTALTPEEVAAAAVATALTPEEDPLMVNTAQIKLCLKIVITCF